MATILWRYRGRITVNSPTVKKSCSPRLLKGFVPAILEPLRIGVHNPSASNVDSFIGSSSRTLRRSITITAAATRNTGTFSPPLPACLRGVTPSGAFAARSLAAEQRQSPFSGRFRSSSDSCRGYRKFLRGRRACAAGGWYYLNSAHRWRSGRGWRVAEKAGERVVVPVPEKTRVTSMKFR